MNNLGGTVGYSHPKVIIRIFILKEEEWKS